MSSSTTNIIPRDCLYKCSTRIYWNTLENAYFEVFSKKKHVCPNRSASTANTNTNTNTNANSNNKPSYYNYKKSWNSAHTPKPKMSNSLEMLTGPITEIQRKYEILSDIVSEYNGKVHGSQSHITANNMISLVVYYEIPEGKREEVKRKFNFFLINKSGPISIEQV
jgi:hypothetical protein